MEISHVIKKISLLLLLPILLNAQDCYDSYIKKPSLFKGNNGEIFQLENKVIGVVKNEHKYIYTTEPKVKVCPKINKLFVNGKVLNIKLLQNNKFYNTTNTSLIKSKISGEFEGFEEKRIIKLTNGQIWQQTEDYYEFMYDYNPRIIIYQAKGSFKMLVDGVSKSIKVVRIK